MSPYWPHNVVRAFGTHWGLDLPGGFPRSGNQPGESLLYLEAPVQPKPSQVSSSVALVLQLFLLRVRGMKPFSPQPSPTSFGPVVNRSQRKKNCGKAGGRLHAPPTSHHHRCSCHRCWTWLTGSERPGSGRPHTRSFRRGALPGRILGSRSASSLPHPHACSSPQ